MISHVTLGSDDLDRAISFYAPLFEALDLQRVPAERSKTFAMWHGADGFRPLIALAKPENDRAQTPGNGQMLALLAKSRAKVDQVHALAIDGGAIDEGKPGLRPHYHPNFYGAYFRDLDGNKICIVCHNPD